jgi:hypothetical protein
MRPIKRPHGGCIPSLHLAASFHSPPKRCARILQAHPIMIDGSTGAGDATWLCLGHLEMALRMKEACYIARDLLHCTSMYPLKVRLIPSGWQSAMLEGTPGLVPRCSHEISRLHSSSVLSHTMGWATDETETIVRYIISTEDDIPICRCRPARPPAVEVSNEEDGLRGGIPSIARQPGMALSDEGCTPSIHTVSYRCYQMAIIIILRHASVSPPMRNRGRMLLDFSCYQPSDSR